MITASRPNSSFLSLPAGLSFLRAGLLAPSLKQVQGSIVSKVPGFCIEHMRFAGHFPVQDLLSQASVGRDGFSSERFTDLHQALVVSANSLQIRCAPAPRPSPERLSHSNVYLRLVSNWASNFTLLYI